MEEERKLEGLVHGDERDEELYKRDAFRQVYIDKRHEATVLLAIRDKYRIKTLSEFHGVAWELLAEILTSTGEHTKVVLSNEAEAILAQEFGKKTPTRGRGVKAEKFNLALDKMRLSKAAQRDKKPEVRGSEYLNSVSNNQEDELEKAFFQELNEGSSKPARSSDIYLKPSSEMSEGEFKAKEQTELEKMKEILRKPPEES